MEVLGQCSPDAGAGGAGSQPVDRGVRVRSAVSVAESRTRPQFNPKARVRHRTSTIDAQTYDRHLVRDRHCGGSPCVFLDGHPYERLTNMASQARADCRQFLEHLILRAEAVWNFELPVLPPPRPWWKLWSKELVPELPAIVADLHNAS